MSAFSGTDTFLSRLLGALRAGRVAPRPSRTSHVRASDTVVVDGREQIAQPEFSETDLRPEDLTTVQHPDGRMSQYPPTSRWHDWVEWDSKSWPKKVARRYTLVPTICFNCESACGLLAYVDKQTYGIRKFEGNPEHPGSRGRNCAKGPATHNQTYDPERILHPLKRVGARGEGKWKRISWDEAIQDIAGRMRESRARRRDGIMYHVGRPGEDHYANRTIQAWGVDGHNSHTNICSAAARAGYTMWTGMDRPSPDYANARAIVLISAHLESGHYFNPHAQRIIEAQQKGAKIITLDPRLSNTAAKSDVWIPSWPGSEATILLAVANHLIQTDQYDKEFVARWVNWEESLRAAPDFAQDAETGRIAREAVSRDGGPTFDDFDAFLKALYRDFTFERAAEEGQVPIERIREMADILAAAGNRVAAHNWRAASMGNRGGWQVTRSLFFLNVLTGSVGTKGGTSMNSWNKFVPQPHSSPPPGDAWNELHLPVEWPFAMYEMSFLLPHFLEEGRGEIDVYFTRVYNPMWINPDGFMWLKALQDEEKLKLHVALTPTWNESAWFADYVLPMGHAGERHDVVSVETHAAQWIGFRQPVGRVAMERAGTVVHRTHEANPGEVWEESEFWVDLSWAMDPDGALGVREHFESPADPSRPITMDEYFGWIFDHSVPGLPDAAAAEGLTPLLYMRKYGAFSVATGIERPYEAEVDGGVSVDGIARVGFKTPSRLLEFFSPTLAAWGWGEQSSAVPWPLESHVSPRNIDRSRGEMLLLPNFRLPTLIHTRSANAKWLYEISHKNPVWIHTSDAHRLGVVTGDLLVVETEIGRFVDTAWVTEGIKPGIIAVSHHLGRWRLSREMGIGAGMSSVVGLSADGTERSLSVEERGAAWTSSDPDTARVWWKDVGVHQNLTHAVHPDPLSGAHCWHQKAFAVRRARPDERHGDVTVDIARSMAVYREWLALARPATTHSPDGTRRPYWLKRPLKPTRAAYALPTPSASPE